MRTQKPLKESNLFQMQFVIAKIWRRRRWRLAKNPATLFPRWVGTSASDARGYKHPLVVAGTPPQSKRRTTWLFEKQQTVIAIWDRWKNDKTHRVHEWSDVWVRYLDHIAQFDILHAAPHEQWKRHNNLLYLQISKRHLYHNDQDAKMQRKHWLICTCKYDKIAEFLSSQKVQGNACEISSIFQCKGIFVWHSTNWTEYFAEERPQSTSSSSGTPSSSWWTSSSWGINTNGKTLRSQEVDLHKEI